MFLFRSRSKKRGSDHDPDFDKGAAVAALWPVLVWAQPVPKPQPSDQQVAEIVVRESREAYYRTGHPCACPEDLARNGSRCGKRSAYSRPGGAEPYCYLSDVPAAVIARYRTSH
jgi:hypothetical protein